YDARAQPGGAGGQDRYITAVIGLPNDVWISGCCWRQCVHQLTNLRGLALQPTQLVLAEGSLVAGVVDMSALCSFVGARSPLRKRRFSAANRVSTSRRSWANSA